MISSDKVKTVILIVGASLAVYFGVKVYQKIALQKDGVDKATKNAQDILTGIFNDAKTSINNGIGSIRTAVGMPVNDYKMGSEYGARPLNFSVWPASSKRAVDLIKTKRGERISNNSNDYLGWQVFSDGTIISPSNEYMIDRVATGDVTTADTAVRGIGVATSDGFITGDYNIFNYTPPVSSALLPNMSDNIPY